MSCLVSNNRSRLLSRVAFVAIITGVTGCSSDFHRFDQSFYDNAMPTQNDVASANPYPANVDTTTTASISRSGIPVPSVGLQQTAQLAPISQGGQIGMPYQNGLVGQTGPVQLPSGSAAPKTLAQLEQARTVYNTGAATYGQPETYQSYKNTAQNLGQTSSVYQQANGGLSKANSTYSTIKQGIADPKAAATKAVTDRIVTGSIQSPQSLLKTNFVSEEQAPVPASPVLDKAVSSQGQINQSFKTSVSKIAQNNPAQYSGVQVASADNGWTAIGGTRIEVKEGETLYNLSKRFGVPVDSLMEANNITDPSQVRSGQTIVIPTYVYSQSNKISAPDANLKTKASRSSTGYMGEVAETKAITPSKRPADYVFTTKASPVTVEQQPQVVKKPVVASKAIKKADNVDRSIVTGTVKAGGSYKVEAGDSLYGIARKHKVGVTQLKAANGIGDDNLIRLGQWLKIPDGSEPIAKPVVNKVAKVQTKTEAPKPVKAPVLDQPKAETAKVEEPKVEVKTAEVAKPKPYVKPTVDKTITNSLNQNAPERSGIGSWRWPVHGRVISKFGELRGNSRNDGIDISVPEGTAVKAVENGVVIYASNELQQFGNLILIRHEGGYVSAYANTKNFEVHKGDNVRRGQIIARSGRTGNVSQPQLHFELRKNSTPVDPTEYFKG